MIEVSSKDGEELAAIVFISMIFSVLSMLMACMLQITRVFEICKPQSNKYSNKLTVSGQLKLHSSQLLWYHAFANNRVAKCMNDVLQTEAELSQIVMNYNIEIYYFEDFTTTLNQLNAHFNITMHSFDQTRRYEKLFTKIVRSMGDISHPNHNKLVNVKF